MPLLTLLQLTFGILAGPWITDMSETGFSVLWTTSSPTMGRVILSDGCAEREFVQKVSGRAVTSCFHRVDVSGLEPGGRYSYRIRGKELVNFDNPYVGVYTEEHDFTPSLPVRTFDRNAEECTFSVVNDMHFQAGRYHDLCSRIDTEEEDFLLLCGDIVSYANDIDTVMHYFFNPVSEVVSRIPVVFCRGNHETKGADTRFLPKLFPTPTGELYYSFRVGPVAFVVLDNGGKTPDSDPSYGGDAYYDEYRAEELEWLKGALNEESFRSARYKVAVVHMPFHGDAKGSYAQKEMSRTYMPVLGAGGIDLMLCGHQHVHNHYAPGEVLSTLPDGSTATNSFPIITNSNTERLKFHADPSGITVETYALSDSLTHRYVIR